MKIKKVIAIACALACVLAVPAGKAYASFVQKNASTMHVRNIDGAWVAYNQNGIADHYYGYASNENGWWLVLDGKVAFNYTGMAFDGKDWRYVLNGYLLMDYTGMASNENGWWYFTDGELDWTYTGMANNEYGWWYYKDGHIDWDYTGMAENEYGWWYFTNGQIDWTYSGIAENEDGKWLYQNGRLSSYYTGMLYYENTWIYIHDGFFAEDYTGIAENEYGYWYFTNGKLDRSITGMCEVKKGEWRYFVNGSVDYHYTGCACDGELWWYFKDGELDKTFTGIATNKSGDWYFEDGNIDFDYSGSYTDGTITYTILNGKVTAARDRYTMEAWRDSLQKMHHDADVVFFGDSITAYSDFQEYFDGEGVDIVELGLYGDNLENMDERVEMITYVSPEKIFLLGGINELRDNNLDKTVEHYEALLDHIQSACPNAELYIQSVLPVSDEKSKDYASNETIVAFNEEIKKIAEQRGLTYIDLYSLLEKDGYINPSYTTDGLHISDAGYTIWGEAIRDYVTN